MSKMNCDAAASPECRCSRPPALSHQPVCGLVRVRQPWVVSTQEDHFLGVGRSRRVGLRVGFLVGHCGRRHVQRRVISTASLGLWCGPLQQMHVHIDQHLGIELPSLKLLPTQAWMCRTGLEWRCHMETFPENARGRRITLLGVGRFFVGFHVGFCIQAPTQCSNYELVYG